MKTIIIILGLFIFSVQNSFSHPNYDGEKITSIMTPSDQADVMAEIKFDTTVHDFGKIKNGAKDVKFKFKYTNTGNDVLFITRVVKSCGCTEPVYSREPLMPGQSSNVEIGYTTTETVGVFNKKITIFSNANTESVILTIKGEVLPK